MIGRFLSLFLKREKEKKNQLTLSVIQIISNRPCTSEEDVQILEEKLMPLFAQSRYYDITVLEKDGTRHWCKRISDVLAHYRNGRVDSIEALPKQVVEKVVESRLFAHCSW